MRKIIIYVLCLIVAVWIGIRLNDDPGYALFAYKQWTVEMPLWLMIVAVLLLVFIIHNLLRLMHGFKLVGRQIANWMNKRSYKVARKRLTHAFVDLTEGYWQKAEHGFSKNAAHSDFPVLNYLAAARAAHEQGAYERRDEYIRQAYGATEDAEVAVSLTQARLQLSHQQFEQALATLQHLKKMMPHHTYVLRLLKNIYVELKDWQQLKELLPELRQHHVIKEEEIADLEIKTYQALFELTAKNSDFDSLQDIWVSLAKSLRKNDKIFHAYVISLHKLNEDQMAEKLISSYLKKHWQDDLVLLFGQLKSARPDKQLAIAEGWLKQHNQSANLLITLGRIAVKCELWGKARDYYEKSIFIKPNRVAYRELGILLEQQLQEKTAAFNCYRQGLLLNN